MAYFEHLSIVRIDVLTPFVLFTHSIVVPELPIEVVPPKFSPLPAEVGR